MNRRQSKREIVELLLHSDLFLIRKELQTYPENQAFNALFSCLCHPRERVRWHAVSAFGFLLPGVGEKNLEAARTIMRRFLWMLNDESGGIGWGVPEAMAEVMFHSPMLAAEYVHMLVSYTMDDGPEQFQDGNFIELDRLQEGVLWGLCRLAPVYREELIRLGLGENLGVYFHSVSGAVRGLACRLTGMLMVERYRDNLNELLSDPAPVRYYLEGVFTDTTVAKLSEIALHDLT